VAGVIANQQARSPDALCLITGDFNHCNLKKTLPTFHQYVDCPTRNDKTLDLFYCNVKDAYRCYGLPPLGKSDHCLVNLLPKYTPVVKRQSPVVRSVQCWTPEACDELRGCMECTDWDVFVDSCETLDELSETVSDYINFCVDSVIPVKQVTHYANSKPWITRDIRDLLKKKRSAFASGDKEELRAVQKELKKAIREGKEQYKQKLEAKLERNNVKDVWQGMQKITGYSKKNKFDGSSSGSDFADELNTFYARFDVHDFKDECNTILRSDDVSNSAVQEPVTLSVDDVCKQLKKINVNKSAGPDGVKPKVLSICADQLCKIFHTLFSMSLSLCKIPSAWKTSCIVPVPKKASVTCLNDYRPVALTSHIMKVFERLLLPVLKTQVAAFQDPLQFAYRAKVGVDDALLYMLHSVYTHLEKSSACVRIMFFDFSSAFQTIQPHLLAKKLQEMFLHPNTVKWVLDYLTDRPQFVRWNGIFSSETINTFTGAPQGTVLSPFLFTLYTSDFKVQGDSCHLQKFSDDSAVVGCILDNDEILYRERIDDFVSWCDENFLVLNASKTKEMVFDFRKKKDTVHPVIIKGETIEIVTEYKYLGVKLDNKLTWSNHIDAVYKKTQSRLFFLRKLRSFNVCNKMLYMFYQSMVCSVMVFASVCWGGNASARDTGRLNKLIKKASSVVGQSLDQIEVLVERRLASKSRAILLDPEHPLNSTLMDLRIQRSGRFTMPKVRTERFRRSFIPAAVRFFNNNRAIVLTSDFEW
jgi:hypothetical protein